MSDACKHFETSPVQIVACFELNAMYMENDNKENLHYFLIKKLQLVEPKIQTLKS